MASTASSDLAVEVLLVADSSDFLTSCWVIVEPPWLTPPASTFVEQRAQRGPQVDAVVAREIVVLDGEDGVDDVLGHLVERHRRAVLLDVQRGQERAVGRVDVRALVERPEVDLRRPRSCRLTSARAAGASSAKTVPARSAGQRR